MQFGEATDSVDRELEEARKKLRDFEEGADNARIMTRLRTASPAHPVLLLQLFFLISLVVLVVTLAIVFAVPFVGGEWARSLGALDERVGLQGGLPAVLGVLTLCMGVGWVMAGQAALAIAREAPLLAPEQKDHQRLVNEVTRLSSQKSVQSRIKGTPMGARPRISTPVPVSLRQKGGAAIEESPRFSKGASETPAYLKAGRDESPGLSVPKPSGMGGGGYSPPGGLPELGGDSIPSIPLPAGGGLLSKARAGGGGAPAPAPAPAQRDIDDLGAVKPAYTKSPLATKAGTPLGAAPRAGTPLSSKSQEQVTTQEMPRPSRSLLDKSKGPPGGGLKSPPNSTMGTPAPARRTNISPTTPANTSLDKMFGTPSGPAPRTSVPPKPQAPAPSMRPSPSMSSMETLKSAVPTKAPAPSAPITAPTPAYKSMSNQSESEVGGDPEWVSEESPVRYGADAVNSAAEPDYAAISEPWLQETLERAQSLAAALPTQAKIQYSVEEDLPFTLVLERATPALAVRSMMAFVEFLAGIPTPARARIEVGSVAHLDKTFHRNVSSALEPYFPDTASVERQDNDIEIVFSEPDEAWQAFPRIPGC